MTYEGSPSGFRDSKQAAAIATVLEQMSDSVAYREKEQSLAKRLAGVIRRYIKEGTVLEQRVTFFPGEENVLREAFDIYVTAKRGNEPAEE